MTRAPNPTASSSSSAALQVFDTVELLESIILLLPCKDALLSQRISKTWKLTVAGSLRVQKTLFLVPSQAPLKACIGGIPIRPLDSNSLWVRDNPSDSMRRVPFVVNPFFAVLFSLDESKAGDGYGFDYDFTKAIVDGHETSSWKKMYMTNPPPQGHRRVLGSERWRRRWVIRVGSLGSEAKGKIGRHDR